MSRSFQKHGRWVDVKAPFPTPSVPSQKDSHAEPGEAWRGRIEPLSAVSCQKKEFIWQEFPV